MKDVTLRRYSLPSNQQSGWAIIVIGSDGYFSCVSDHGNYSYIWSHPGMEFRKFLAKLDASYFHSKICHLRESRAFDDEQTKKNIRKRLWEMMDPNGISKDEHDDAQASLDDASFDHPSDVAYWAGNLPFDFDLYDVVATIPEPWAWAFATKVLPRFQALLRAELAAEEAAA